MTGFIIGFATQQSLSNIAAGFMILLYQPYDVGHFIVLKSGTPAGPYGTLSDAQAAGAVTTNYGVFINTVISFMIVAFAVFLLIRYTNKLKRKEEAPPSKPTTKNCPYCYSTIPIKATRCPECTSELKEA